MDCKRLAVFAMIVFAVCFSSAICLVRAEEKVDGEIAFKNKCAKCHPLSVPLKKIKDLERWKITILRMSKKKNSEINPEEVQQIAEYLSSIAGK